MSSSRSLCTICVGSEVTRNLYVSREAHSSPLTVFWFVCGALVPLCKQCRCTAVWQLVLPFYAIHIFLPVLLFLCGWLWEISVTQASQQNPLKLQIHEAFDCFPKHFGWKPKSLNGSREHLCTPWNPSAQVHIYSLLGFFLKFLIFF